MRAPSLGMLAMGLVRFATAEALCAARATRPDPSSPSRKPIPMALGLVG